MGWTFLHREKGSSNIDWLRGEFSSEPDRIIDVATKNGTMYVAYRTPVDEGEVRCLVILTRWVRGDYYNFGYKDMDEGMGPNEDDCPRRIFDLLTPLKPGESEWAEAWRARVQARLDRPPVRKGTRVRFPDWRWRGGDYGVVRYMGKHNLFLTEGGRLVRFTGWRNGPYEVVS